MSLKSAIDFVFANSPSDQAREALAILVTRNGEPYRSDMEDIREIFEGDGDYRSAADAMLAIVECVPLQAHKCCEVFTVPLRDDFYVRPQLTAGVVLGIFKIGVWLDINWKTPTEFERTFPALLAGVIPSRRLGDGDTPGHQTVEWEQAYVPLDAGFEPELSKAVKAFVRGVNFPGVRSGGTWKLMELLGGEFKREQELSPLGRLIVDQLCYAEYGNISTQARLRAMNLFMDELLPRPLKLALMPH